MNEKALVRLMKEAYKGGGVKVWRTEWDYVDLLMVSTGFWAAAMPMEQVPGKVLGLLGEWLRRLPLIDEAYMLRQRTEPERLNVREDHMPLLLEAQDDLDFTVDLKPTPFYVGDKRALQRRDDRQMLFFKAELLELAGGFLHTGAANRSGQLAQWRQPDTDAVVWLWPRNDVSPTRAALLAQYDCWEEQAHD